MRVLLSAYACAPNYGTEPGNGWNWAVHLAERGMEVRVLAEEGARAAIEEYCREHPETKVRFTFFRGGPAFLCRHSGLRYILWQRRAVREAKKLMRSERYEVVHHVTFGSVQVPTQLWRLGIPVVFGPVGGGQTAPASMLSYFGPARRKERFRTLTLRLLPFSPWHRRSYRKIGLLLGTNRETLNVFRAMGRDDAALFLDAGLPDSFFASQPRVFAEEPTPLRVLWVGRLLPRKALPLTLDIMAKVSVPFTLTILGSGLPEHAVRAMIHARGLEGRVIWKPERVPWSEVREAYRTHDVLLFNSLRDSLGAQLLEAMAMGLPVICLDLSGARDFVPAAAGYKVPVCSKEQVVMAVSAAVNRFGALPAAERNEMSRVALAFAKQHSWRTRAAAAETMYQELLAADKPEPSDTSALAQARWRAKTGGKF